MPPRKRPRAVSPPPADVDTAPPPKKRGRAAKVHPNAVQDENVDPNAAATTKKVAAPIARRGRVPRKKEGQAAAL